MVDPTYFQRSGVLVIFMGALLTRALLFDSILGALGFGNSHVKDGHREVISWPRIDIPAGFAMCLGKLIMASSTEVTLNSGYCWEYSKISPNSGCGVPKV